MLKHIVFHCFMKLMQRSSKFLHSWQVHGGLLRGKFGTITECLGLETIPINKTESLKDIEVIVGKVILITTSCKPLLI